LKEYNKAEPSQRRGGKIISTTSTGTTNKKGEKIRNKKNTLALLVS